MAYQLSSSLHGSGFLSAFNFFTGPDPSHGFVSYQSQHNAEAMGLYSVDPATNAVRLGVDSKNVYSSSQGRPSLRLESKQAFEHGLFIADFGHMPPSTCGLWPAFWAFGDPWPTNGEIDIIEGVNTNTQNIISAHTRDGCSIDPVVAYGFTGGLRTSSCAVGAQNVGCGVDPPSSDTSSYGDGFNAAGGGVYAMKWENKSISIWHFARDDIPDDIDRKKPNPSRWGLPQAIFGGPSCNADSFFKNMNLVININFCGDYGSGVWGKTDSCDALAPTCNEYVANNPHAFADAYWDVNYIDVYQTGGKGIDDSWLPFETSSWLPFSSTHWPFANHASTSGPASSSSTRSTTMIPQVEATSPVTAAVQIRSTSVAPSMSVATSSHFAASMTHLPSSSSSSRASSTATVVSHSASSLSRSAAMANASSSSSAMANSSSSRERMASLDSRTSTASPLTVLPVKMPEMTSSVLNVSQATKTRVMPANAASSSASLPSSLSSSPATSSAVFSDSSKSISAKIALPTKLNEVIPTTVSPSSHAAAPSTAERIPAQSAESKVSTAEHLMQWNATTFATTTVTKTKPITATHVVLLSPLPETRAVQSAAHTVPSIMTIVDHRVETDSVTVTKTRTQRFDETWTWEHDAAATTPATLSAVSQAASSPHLPVDVVAESAETSVLEASPRPIQPVAAPAPLSQPTPSSPAPAAQLARPAIASSGFHHSAGHNISVNAAFLNGTGRYSRPTAFHPVPPPQVEDAPMAKIPMDAMPQPSQLSMGSAAPSDLGMTRKSAVFAGLMALAVMMVANA